MAGSSSQSDDEGIVGINVTPLVDITLVLLIIFMVTAKIIVSQSVPLDLPKASTGQDVQTVFSIELHANGDTVVDSKKLGNDDGITPLAREAHAKNAELRAVIKADSTVQHGRVIHVLDLLKREGVNKVAFGVSPIENEPAPPGTAPAPQPGKP